MEQLIKNILQKSELKFNEIDFEIKTIFSYFNDGREDYFLMFFLNFSELNQLNNNSNYVSNDINLQKLEFLFNAIIEEIINKNLEKFNFKNLDYNLSTILFLNIEEPSENILTELHKIEENYRVSKKYVLPYKQEDLEIIKEKLRESEDIIYDLNKISIDNYKLMKFGDETWYRLLMNLFIKIPFLNFQDLTQSGELKDISKEINNDLDYHQKIILDKIIEYDENQDVEKFLIQNNFFIKSNE